tara:strand:+ start:818 stop:1315 length:498 start_codon:yes stop_codon:yes gene_type:complete
MWTIIKYKNSNINYLKKDLIEKLGKEVIIYIPKIKYEKINKNKILSFEHKVLGDYLFVYHSKLKNMRNINLIKYCRGLKRIIDGFYNSQREITNFIDKCKNNEDSNGFITKNFFKILIDKKYKFLSGPFTGMICKIVEYENNKIKLLLGKYSTTVSKDKYLFETV